MKVVWATFLFLLVRYTDADFYLPAKKDGSLFLQDLGNYKAPLWDQQMNVTIDIRPQFEIEFILSANSDKWINYKGGTKRKTQDILRLGKTKISYNLNGELDVSHYVDGKEKLFTTTRFRNSESSSEHRYVRISQLKNADGKYVFTIFWQAHDDDTETITVENTTPYSKQDGKFERYEMQSVIRETEVFGINKFNFGFLRVATHDCSSDNYFDGQQCKRHPIIIRKDEFMPKQNHPIANFPLRKQFELELEVNPGSERPGATWHNVIRVGTYWNTFFYGDRFPTIYTHKNGLDIRRDISGKKDQQTPPFVDDNLPLNQWTKIRITQLLTEDGKYQYDVHISDKRHHTEIDEKPTEIFRAMLWAGESWNTAANVKIRNLRFVSHDCPFGHYLDHNSAECKKGQKVDVDWSSWTDCVNNCDDKISTGGSLRSLLLEFQTKYPTKNDLTGNKDGSLIMQNMGFIMFWHPLSAANGQVGKVPIEIHSQFDIEFYVKAAGLKKVNEKVSYTAENPLNLMRMGKTLIAYGGSQFIISHFVNGAMMTFTTKNLAGMITENHQYVHIRVTEFKNKDGKYDFTIYLQSSNNGGSSHDWYNGIFMKKEPERLTIENQTPYSSHISEFERYPMPRELYWNGPSSSTDGTFIISNVKVSTHNCALDQFFDGKRCSRFSTFQHKDEINLVKNKLLGVFPLFKQYDIEAEVWLSDPKGCWLNVLGVGNLPGFYGYNTPDFIVCDEKLYLWATVNGQYDWPGRKISAVPKTNEWQHYRVSQLLDKEGKLMLTWTVDGKTIASIHNTLPAEALTSSMSITSHENVPNHAKIRNVRYVGHDCSEHQYFNEKNPMKCYENRHRFDEKDGWTTKIGYSKAKLFCEDRKLELCSIKDLCPQIKASKIKMEESDSWVAAVSSAGPISIQVGSRKENASPNFCQTHTDAIGSRADWHDKDTDADGNGYPFRSVMYCCGKKGEWTPWTGWSSCTKTCDKGTTKRNRECYNKKPNEFGCEGSDTEEKPCNEHGCPFQMCDVKSADNKVTCDDEKMTIKLAKCFSDPKMKITLKDDKCKAVVSGTSVVLESGLEQCGMTMSSDEEHIVFENTLVLQTTEKTSDDKPGLIFTPKIKVRCKFPASSSTNMKLSVTVDNTESTTGVGVFEFVADSYTDAKFEVTSNKPKVVGSQVYLGVKPKAPLPSDLSFYVTKCTVSNASTSYNILNDRCPNTVVRGEADKGDSTTLFKIKYYAFQFHDSADEEVTSYDVACTVRLCLKGKCPAQPSCP